MLYTACCGDVSDTTTRPIITTSNCLIQRLNDIYGISDQIVLTSINPNSSTNQRCSLKTPSQSNFLLTSTNRLAKRSTVRKFRSSGLPASTSPPAYCAEGANQTAKGLLAMYNSHRVGIHKA